jgi:hypothetical protein
MQGFMWLLKSFGIDLSPDGIKEMFSKVTGDDIRRVVGELGLNADEILAMPKMLALKLQEFEQRQIRILTLLEENHVGNSRDSNEQSRRFYTDIAALYPTATDAGTNRRGDHDPSSGGSNGIVNGTGDQTQIG